MLLIKTGIQQLEGRSFRLFDLARIPQLMIPHLTARTSRLSREGSFFHFPSAMIVTDRIRIKSRSLVGQVM
jgi:hypothetical protein